jgi:hypothetical protein
LRETTRLPIAGALPIAESLELEEVSLD